MRKLMFNLVCLVIAGFCSFGQPLCQTSGDLSLRPDAFLQNSKPYGFGIERIDQNRLELIPEKSHYIEGDVKVAWIKHFASGLGSGHDVSTAVAIDKSGNVFVTGYSSGLPYGSDYLTIKYDDIGNQIWIARYNGDENGGDDLAYSVNVDELGNVYVTGTSWGSNSGKDFATVKYNSSGEQLWVARYNGFGANDDEAAALVVDQFGNVYVTGKSMGSGTGYDYATVKFNANGTMEWVARYNGSKNSDDAATAIAIDDFGNLYVTGYSDNQESSWDYTTIRYDAQGNKFWVAHYNGSSNGNDAATDIAIDRSGTVYVTGYSWGEGDDYATIKYDSGGNELWVARYNKGYDIANSLTVDVAGNAYVTGLSDGLNTNFDYATVKYNSSGEMQWVARYNGTANHFDVASNVAIDKDGNVYVTGTSLGLDTDNDFVTIKYNNLGVEQWIACYNGFGNSSDETYAMAIDSSGDVVVTGTSWNSETDNDYAIVKYTSSGTQKWIARYDGSGKSSDYACDLTVDDSGNVFVLGSFGSYPYFDYGIVKYNSLGEQQWIASYDGLGHEYDWATDLAIDKWGNLYVTGYSMGLNTDQDYATVKYNSSGVQQWEAHYNGRINGYDGAEALTVDNSGNVYVTGTSYISDTTTEYVTIKYNSSGFEQWVARFSGDENSSNHAYDIVIDGFQNVYVTGNVGTIKYNFAGVQEWALASESQAIALDHRGNVYVTGRSTIKINNAGIQEWNIGFRGVALAVDDSGNVYVAGNSGIIKIDSAGIEHRIASDYSATAIALDGSHNIYVAGISKKFGTAYDYITAKYNSFGIQEWFVRYNGPGNTSDYTTAIAVDDYDYENVYVTGLSCSPENDWSVITTIKYTQTPTSINQEITNHPKEYSLSQNYPNPFNPATTIRYALPRESFVTLKIFNLLGQEVATLVDELKPMGEHQVQWQAGDLPSGVYLYRVEARCKDNINIIDFMETKKLILLK